MYIAYHRFNSKIQDRVQGLLMIIKRNCKDFFCFLEGSALFNFNFYLLQAFLLVNRLFIENAQQIHTKTLEAKGKTLKQCINNRKSSTPMLKAIHIYNNVSI